MTRLSLQAAGGAACPGALGASQEAPARRPMPGMMLYQDALRFAWLPGDERQYDLMVTLDDATSAIYSAFLVE